MFGESHEMKSELHPNNNRREKKTLGGGLWRLVRTFLLTDDSANELLCFLVWPETAMGITM